MHVKLTLLLTNSMQTKQQIFLNENLKIISLPNLTTATNILYVRHASICFSYAFFSLLLLSHTQLLHSSSPPPQHQTSSLYTALFPSHLQSIYLSILTGCSKSKAQEAVRIQACKCRSGVHRQTNRPIIPRRGPQQAGAWKIRWV